MVQYEPPSIPALLTVASFLFLNNLSDIVLRYVVNAGLIGPLVLGIIYGPDGGNILSDPALSTFMILGYIGLILLVFEGGLTTNVSLLYKNAFLSIIAASTGILLPIGLSILLLHFGYGYSIMQAFASGAALCSTSLGTTLALLKPEIRRTRVAVVLTTAAIFDDVVALVIASIVQQIASHSGTLQWQTIVRPILVSIGFVVIVILACRIFRALLRRFDVVALRQGRVHLLIMIPVLCGFVAGSKYAGGSDLFGAYLAGLFITYVFTPLRDGGTPETSFNVYIQPIQQTVLSPLFFASIGASLPVRSLGSINGSKQVVWRGILYSLLMMLAKAAVGIWPLVWSVCKRKKPSTPVEKATQSDEDSIPRAKAAALLGLSLIPRGEIALVVAQFARPLLVETDRSDSEQFAVVIWAILTNTIGGALAVGAFSRHLKLPGDVVEPA